MIHNGGPPIDTDAPGLRVIRIHINDWVASTRGMSLDEEGFFWRFTCLFYDRMGQIPDDDQLNARAMSLDVRRYRHLKNIMVRLGKISVEDGRLTNARAEREITLYLAEFKRRSDAAKERENRKRASGSLAEIDPDFAPTSPRLRPDFGTEVAPMSDRLRPDTDVEVSELFNKNKERNATTVTTSGPEPSRARPFPKPKPKPIEEKKDPLTPPSGGPAPVDQVFEEFWSAFPAGRKQAKGDARDVFRKIVTGKHRKGLRAKAETLIAAAIRYAESKPDPEYVPMPSTWLNGGRWDDDVQPSAETKSLWWQDPDRLASITDDRWCEAIGKFANGIWPVEKLGPPPGSKKCVVPRHISDELRLTEKYDANGISREKH